MITLKPGQTLCFDGDSLTSLRKNPTLDQWPWLRISNNHRAWGDVFSELLFAWRPDLNLTFRTAAVGGSTCLDLEKRFDDSIAQIRPDWVFMTLGSNDARRQIPLEKFASVLHRYAETLAAWEGQLVFLYNLQACRNADMDSMKKEELRKPYYRIQETLAETEHNVQLIDVGTPLKEKAEQLYLQYSGHNIYSDGNHFSNLGAMIIAGEVLKACGVVTDTQ